MNLEERYRVYKPVSEEGQQRLYLNVFYEAGRLQYEFSKNKEESFETMTLFTDVDLEYLPDKEYLSILPREYLKESEDRTEVK